MTKNIQKDKQNRKHISFDLSFTGLLIYLLFRIPISNIIGSEGNGYYFISFEIFTLFYIIFGFCFHQVTFQLIRKHLKKYSNHTKSTLVTLLMIVTLLSSILGSFLLFISSKWILSFLHMELSILTIRVLCPWMIITSVSGVFRGYFEGCGSKIPTAFSRIIEALIAGSGGIIFTSILYKYGFKVGDLLFNPQYQPAFGASGLVSGLLCGGIFAFIFLFVVYQFYHKYQKQATNNGSLKEVSKRSLLLEIVKTYFICLFALLFMYSYRFVNMTLYISTLTKQMQEDKIDINILSLLGSYHGKVLVLIGIPVLVILSFCGNNIPRIRKNYSKCSYSNCWKYTYDDLKQILITSIPVCVIFALISGPMLNFLYGKSNITETNFLKIESLCIIFIPLTIYLYQLIQKLNLKWITLVIPFIAFLGQSILMYLLVNTANVRMLSIVIAEVVFWFLLVLMELLIIMKEFGQIFSTK